MNLKIWVQRRNWCKYIIKGILTNSNLHVNQEEILTPEEVKYINTIKTVSEQLLKDWNENYKEAKKIFLKEKNK